MLGNFEMEIQTAKHIAGNRSDKGSRFVVAYMLATALSVLGLFFFTPLDLFDAAISALVLSFLLAVPFSLIWARRRKAKQAKLYQFQMEKMKESRANQTLDN